MLLQKDRQTDGEKRKREREELGLSSVHPRNTHIDHTSQLHLAITCRAKPQCYIKRNPSLSVPNNPSIRGDISLGISPLSLAIINPTKRVTRAPSLRGDGGTTPPCYEAKRKVWQTRSINSRPRGVARSGAEVWREGRGETHSRGAARLRRVSRPRRSHRLAQLRPSSSPPLALRTPLSSSPPRCSLALCLHIYPLLPSSPVATLADGSQKATSRAVAVRRLESLLFTRRSERARPG